MRALLVVLVVSGCGPTGYYVADIRPTTGGFEVTKCAFDDRGKAETGNCTTETIATSPETIVPAPPEAAPRRARPAPTAEQVKAELDGKSVHGLIEQCRATYAKDLTSFSFRVTIDPSHGVTNVEPSGTVDATFADCAAKALRAADVPRFDGPPVTYDEALAL